ncbi:uncharacterized protein LOC108671876 [Hyalella azteca]|uniref:Uncharacterized protein LOC108671876 n=1 Tax=Hyalella azteca TaxID=294128 RepID=A0A979FX60_HYAAZ|nr:uncharacterized protein LOC108671876 [Hyalella azteca]
MRSSSIINCLQFSALVGVLLATKTWIVGASVVAIAPEPNKTSDSYLKGGSLLNAGSSSQKLRDSSGRDGDVFKRGENYVKKIDDSRLKTHDRHPKSDDSHFNFNGYSSKTNEYFWNKSEDPNNFYNYHLKTEDSSPKSPRIQLRSHESRVNSHESGVRKYAINFPDYLPSADHPRQHVHNPHYDDKRSKTYATHLNSEESYIISHNPRPDDSLLVEDDSSTAGKGRMKEAHIHKFHPPRMGRTKPRVVVHEGYTARLPCTVHHLGDRSVTWMRRRDLHILTAGQLTYSADDRFQVSHPAGSSQWSLVVADARTSDSGHYHCTVNTDPQIYSVVTLIVTAKENPSYPLAKGKVFVANNTASTTDGRLTVLIHGPRELHIEEGSSLTLRCTVWHTGALPSVVYWYHGNTLLDYNSPRGGVELKGDEAKGQTDATLRVWSVGPGDSGMYSCVPQGSHPASVLVHVQKGDREAAIQQGGLDSSSEASSSSMASGGLRIHHQNEERILLQLIQFLIPGRWLTYPMLPMNLLCIFKDIRLFHFQS